MSKIGTILNCWARDERKLQVRLTVCERGLATSNEIADATASLFTVRTIASGELRRTTTGDAARERAIVRTRDASMVHLLER